MRSALTAALLLVLTAASASAWTVEEHRLLADSALARATAVLDSADRARLRGPLRAPWGAGEEAPTFASVCAAASADDGSRGRYHARGRSVMEQLAGLTAAEIDTLTNDARRGDEDLLRGSRDRFEARVRRLERDNVVEGYLVHHVIALRIGFRGGDRDSLIRCALLYEAIAQSYLADAFASGHLMPPPGGGLNVLHPVNRGRQHAHYAKHGLYVLDARGEVWQTFGDQLLLWYGPSYEHVLAACAESLREVLLAAYGGRDAVGRALGSDRHYLITSPGHGGGGDTLFFYPEAFVMGVRGTEWFDRYQLEGLMRIPIPVTATWSVRTDSLDAHGLAVRRHYPQFIERGGHEVALDEDEVEQLPGLGAHPPWMVPDDLFARDPAGLVRDNPDWASVRFVQPDDPSPSYTGLVTMGGYHGHDDATGGGGHYTYGVGYSPAGENAVLFQRLSVDALVLEPGRDGGPRAWALALGFNVRLPELGIWREPWIRWLEGVRWSVGHAWDRGENNDSDGARYTVGLESPAIPLRFTNAALAMRVEGEWMRLDRPQRGLGVMLVLQ